ncbi:hypothetical protein GEMRC1_011770 [Eukaryota sp. GEM-RC1]
MSYRKRRSRGQSRPPKTARIIGDPIILDDELLSSVLKNYILRYHPFSKQHHVDYMKIFPFCEKFLSVSTRLNTIASNITNTLPKAPSPLSTITPVSPSKCCYVTLLMRGDSYLPGILTLGHTLKNSSHDLFCLCTPDVSENSKELISKIYTHVVDIPYNYDARIQPTKWKRFGKLYQWIGCAFTKFNALELTQYDKVLFLDADTLCLNVNIMDQVFQLNCPAGTLSGDFSIKHGRIILRRHLENSLQKAYGISGDVLLLKPSIIDLIKLGRFAHEYLEQSSNDNAGPDESVLSRFYSNQWTQIGAQFNALPWKTVPNQALIHYVTHPPWNPKDYWADYELFYSQSRKVIEEIPESEPVFASALKWSKA